MALNSNTQPGAKEKPTDKDFKRLNTVLSQFTDRADYCAARAWGADTYVPYTRSALQRVLVVVRHGDRVPNHVLTTDANDTWTCVAPTTQTPMHSPFHAIQTRKRITQPRHTGPPLHFWHGRCTVSELTRRGEKMMRDLGKRAREVYVGQLNFLPKNLDLSAISFRSTDSSRTLASASAFLQGMYAPTSPDSSAHAPVVPIQVYPLAIDPWHVRGLRHVCAGLSAAYTHFQHHPLYLASRIRFQHLLAQLRALPLHAAFMHHDVDPEGLPGTLEHVLCRHCHGKPTTLFSHTHVDQLWRLKSFSLWFHYAFFPSTAVQRMWVHPMVQELRGWLEHRPQPQHVSGQTAVASVQHGDRDAGWWPLGSHQGGPKKDDTSTDHNMKKNDENYTDDEASENARYQVVVTHDGTLYQLLMVLNQTHAFGWPGYRAHVVLEVYADDHVRVFYNGQQVRPPSCTDLHRCTASALHAYLARYTADDWVGQCTAAKKPALIE